MAYPTLSPGEASARGKAIYEERLRSFIETEENIGKLLSIEVMTGDCVLDDAEGMGATRRLRARHAAPEVYTLRVGYDAVYSFGGMIERTAP